jgi:hypothetical protein
MDTCKETAEKTAAKVLHLGAAGILGHNNAIVHTLGSSFDAARLLLTTGRLRQQHGAWLQTTACAG